jgi:threonyl-tRNA synthetase
LNIFTGDKERDDRIREYAMKIYNNLKNREIRVVNIETTKTQLSNMTRILESIYKPYIIIYIGEKEVNNNIYSIRYYNISNKSIEEKKIKEEELYDLIEKLEKPLEELNNRKYRLFEDFNFIFE